MGWSDDPDVPGLVRETGGTQGQDRAAGPAQDRLGHAPGQQPAQARPPVRPHDDQVGPDLIGRVQDLFRGRTDPRAVFHLEGMIRGIDFAQALLQGLVVSRVPLDDGELDGLLAEVDGLRRDVHGLRDVEDEDSRLALVRERAGHAEGLPRALREVRGDEDGPEEGHALYG